MLAINVSILGAVVQGGETIPDLTGLISRAAGLLPVGLACIATAIANGLLSATMKARLVFLRWHHALPGHRAFSQLARSDPRIDLGRLKKALGNAFPDTPEAQNTAWYRLFKAVEAASEIQHSHREFLFARDYTGLAALILLVFSAVACTEAPTWKVAGFYTLALVVQYLLARQAAATYGARFVCTVMAVRSSRPPRTAAKSKA